MTQEQTQEIEYLQQEPTRTDLSLIKQYLKNHRFEPNANDEIIFFVLKDLCSRTNMTFEQLDQILKGAFVIIKDEGKLYNRWKRIENFWTPKDIDKYTGKFLPFSSHVSQDQEMRYPMIGNKKLYGLQHDIPAIFELLIGTKKETKNTWFQLERSPYLHLIRHVLRDYLTYCYYGKCYNIGPLGKSQHTQLHNPIVLEYLPTVKRRACLSKKKD